MNPAPGPSEPTNSPAHAALLLDNDLFFSVKIADTLKHVGYRTRTVRALDAFAQVLVAAPPPTIALVNTGARGLDWRAAITAARQAGVPTIAFGSHVDIQTQQEARDLGATSVIANSKLAADLPGVVARTLRRESGVAHSAGDASDQEK